MNNPLIYFSFRAVLSWMVINMHRSLDNIRSDLLSDYPEE